jgi:GntR family transcriptional regulator, rspAB operon transcriptional repressor
MSGDRRILPAQLERRVYERLRDDIVSGLLHPGDQLVEARLAAELGVSKTPVREALIRLQRDGLVEIEPYRGARVLEPSPEDVREILELRVLLECHIARQLAEARPEDVLAALEATVAQGRRALHDGDEAGVASALTAFSDVFADAAENTRLAEVLRGLRSVMLLIGSTSMHASGRTRRSLDEHARILRALRKGDAEAAAAATEKHVRSVERDTLLAAPTAELAS